MNEAFSKNISYFCEEPFIYVIRRTQAAILIISNYIKANWSRSIEIASLRPRTLNCLASSYKDNSRGASYYWS